MIGNGDKVNANSKDKQIMSLCLWTSLIILTLILIVDSISNNVLDWVLFVNLMLLIFDAFMWIITYKTVVE